MTTTSRHATLVADDPRIERTRAAVITAAADLMVRGGPDAITHATVASEANVSRTTVYKHWPTRADLLRSTIEELGKTLPDPDELTGELRADLRLLFGNLVDDLRDDTHSQLIGMMMARAQHDETVAAVRDDMVCDGAALFDEVIAAAISRRELRADLDLQLAMAGLAGALLYMRFMTSTVIDDVVLDRLIDEFVKSNAPR